MINEGLKNLAAGANPMTMKRGIKKATDAAASKPSAQIPSPFPAAVISPVSALSPAATMSSAL